VRIQALLAILVLTVASASASATTIVPTTTLSAETGNNTSAADTWTTSANGDVQSGNVSKVDHHTLLYPGATTPIYTNIMYWFGKSNHIPVGYNSGDLEQVRKQVDDHLSRGLNGTIVDWYGTGHPLDNDATIAMMKYAESLPGQPFKFAIMEDKGALGRCAKTLGCDVNEQLITDLTYIYKTFATSPAYMTVDRHPAVFFFGVDQYGVDWHYVKKNVPGNMVYVFENQSSFTNVHADGAYAWVQPYTTAPTDWNAAYLDNYYLTANRYSMGHNWGATYKGFDDSLASWSLNRITNQDCGQTWLKTWEETNKYYSEKNPLEAMQIVTWNDYEEGTEIETGIDNCVAVSGSMAGSTLNWTISGGLENTIDHYEIFASLDGENLASLASVAAGIHSLDISQFDLDPAGYSLFVKAVGRPSITNKMSEPVAFMGGAPSGTASAMSLNLTTTSGIAPVTVGASIARHISAAAANDAQIDFGDGTVVRSTSAEHVYTVPGTYLVTATTTNRAGKVRRDSKQVVVTTNQAPIAAIALDVMNGIAPATVTATTAGSTDPDGTIVASSIDFGDGTPLSSGSAASHVYASAGTYKVTATVVDDHGARSSTTTTVTLGRPLLRIWRPIMGSSSLSQVHVAATAFLPSDRTLTNMTVYVDDQPAFETPASSLDTWLTMPLGTHTVVVKAADDQGTTYRDMAIVTVKTDAGLTVSSPAPNDTVSGSAHFVADAAAPLDAGITGMLIYVDGAERYFVHVGKIDTVVPLDPGQHAVVVQAWDSKGTLYEWNSTLTVK
jgi:PKD repeat protein